MGLASGHQEGRAHRQLLARRRVLARGARVPFASGVPGVQAKPRWHRRLFREVWSRASFSPPRVLPLTRLVAQGQDPRARQLVLEGAPTSSHMRSQATREAAGNESRWSDSCVQHKQGLSGYPQPPPRPSAGDSEKLLLPGERCQLRVVTCGMRSVSPRERGLRTQLC